MLSLTLHGVILAAAAWFTLGGQGFQTDGTGMDSENEDAAPVATFRPLPPPPKTEPQVKLPPRPVKAFLPSHLKRLSAKTDTATLTLPDWDLPPMAAISAPPPPPKTDPTASPSPDAPPAKTVAKTKSTSTENGSGTGSKTRRKSAGQGSGGGTGNARVATVPPQIVSSYAPPYPSQARKAKHEGTATIQVTVNGSGRVDDVAIYRSAGDNDLDAAALRAVKGWRFTPATLGKATVLVRVTFRLS